MALGLQSYNYLDACIDATGKATTALSSGFPVYAIPLSQCFTKARAAKECWPVSKSLMEALARNPDSSVLKADSSWICLHLAFDKQTGASSKSARATFLSNLPQALDADDCKSDFDSLALELGSDVMSLMHLTFESYSWARAVLNTFGHIFMGEGGEKVEALVPGIELLKKTNDTQVVPKPSDARLETSTANFTEPTVVIYAKQNFAMGEQISWTSMRQYKAAGVTCVVKFPYEECGKSVVDNLCTLLGGAPSSKAGDSCAAEEDTPLQVCLEEGKPVVKTTLHFTVEKPLPGKDVMSLIGVGVLADPDILTQCMKDEASLPGVMQEGECDKRALRYLKPQLDALLSRADGADKEVLTKTLSALEDRLKAPYTSPTSIENKSMKALLAVSLATVKTVEWPADTDKSVEALKACTAELKASQTPSKDKIQVMQTCLKSTIFGDPAAMPLASVASEDSVVNAYREAAEAEMAALAKNYEAESKSVSNSGLKATALSQRGAVQMRMNKFTDALASFQDSLRATPTVTTVTMALECAQAIHAQTKLDFSPSDAGFKATLQQLKEALERKGFLGADVPVPQRYPTSLAVALAGVKTTPESVLARALSTTSEVSAAVELVRFFLLHRPLPVKRARILLTKEVCTDLLNRNILTCFDPRTAATLTHAQASKLVADPESRGSEMIFSNVAVQQVGGNLVMSDFDLGFMVPGLYEPEPYVAHDTAAVADSFKSLVESSKVHPAGAKALADSIPAGLAALAHGARVCFCGSDRFQKLAQMSCALNGFQECEFTSSPSGKFDFVLTSVVALPNPGMVIGNKGPMFKHGMKDLWSEGVKSGLDKLESGGVLVMSSTVTNSGEPKNSKWMKDAHALLDSSCRAAVFTSKPSKIEDLLINLATGCAQVHHYAYMIGLHAAKVTSTSQALLLASKKADSGAGGVEMMPECKSLLSDSAALKSSVQKAYESIVQSGNLQSIVEARTGALYDMDWEDAESTTASDDDKKEAVPTSSPWTTILSKKAIARKIKLQERTEQNAGGNWKEVANAAAMGWTPPINLFSSWRIMPYPQKMEAMPAELPPVAIVELPGIEIPADFMDAMRDTFDAKTKYCFSGESKKFTAESAGKGRRRRRGYAADDDAQLPIDACSVVVVPIPPGSYDDKEPVDLPLQVLYFAQYYAEKVRDGAELLIIILTCNAFGPVMKQYTDTVSKAGSLSGMCRTLRQEVRGLNLWNLDCDNFMPGGDSMEVMAQISLELNCPDHNHEICWREGKRWIRSFELSARNPIRGPAIGPKFAWTQDEPDGVVFITGGTGGLGVVSAEALAEAGAKKIVLGSRSGRVTSTGQGLEERIEAIRAMPGVELIMEKCDTSDEQAVIGALDRARKNLGPIKVIIHTAGVLADTILDFQSQETMTKSFLPKANGAWYLHKHTEQDDLTAFVCFSSVSSLHGNPGQTNYSASNAYMDTLCRLRVHQNKPAISLMWPAVAEVGMAAAGILAKLDFDEMTQVKPDVVKTVMRQCCCLPYPLEPLIAVCPLGTFWPNSQNMALVTEPLFSWYKDEKAFQGALKVAESSEEFQKAVSGQMTMTAVPKAGKH